MRSLHGTRKSSKLKKLFPFQLEKLSEIQGRKNMETFILNKRRLIMFH